ncbi:hypothetical protein ACFR9U_18590 [Halorientalis brevis]|uniref:DUF4352 domain-containing protein n=1 Tax=Halorientalis brevis TaxID=1126241 RepID=A0ABD6CFA9_9EURY|nr:hypothetical protein [Halorientalis brevis]
MKRRALLTSVGVGMAGMAGCLGGNSNDGGSSANKNQAPSVSVSTPKGKKASFTLAKINASSKAEVSKKYQFEITVKNTGDQPGVYQAPAKVRTGDSVKYKPVTNALVYVEPGKTKTAQITLPPFNSVGKADIRFDSPENSWQVDVIGPKLPFGGTFRADGFDITYESIEIKDSVTYSVSGFSSERTYTPPGGSKLAVVTVKLRSIGGADWMADPYNYKARVDGVTRTPFTDAAYGKQTLADGEIKRVKLPYEVPEDATKSDVVFRYNAQRADKYARWSAKYAAEAETGDAGTGSTDEGEDSSSTETTTAG